MSFVLALLVTLVTCAVAAAMQYGYGSWITRNCKRIGRWADRLLPDSEREFANFTAMGEDTAAAVQSGEMGGVHGLLSMARGAVTACRTGVAGRISAALSQFDPSRLAIRPVRVSLILASGLALLAPMTATAGPAWPFILIALAVPCAIPAVAVVARRIAGWTGLWGSDARR